MVDGRHIQRALLVAAAMIAIAVGMAEGQSAPSPVPLPANGSFEDVANGVPEGWRSATYQRTAEFAVDTAARTGARSVRISSTTGADADWTAVIPVRPFARYRLSAWIRTQDVQADTGSGALLNLHGWGRTATAALTGTRDWTEVSLVFDTGGNDAVQINCLFGGWGRSRGTAWFDDVRMEMLSARELEPAATIDAAAKRAPMSNHWSGAPGRAIARRSASSAWTTGTARFRSRSRREHPPTTRAWRSLAVDKAR